MSLFQEILTRSQDVDLNTIEWPKDKIEEDQILVGTISDNAKRIWGLAKILGDRHIFFDEEHHKLCDGNCARNCAAMSGDDRERHRGLVERSKAIKAECELVMEVFWTTVYKEFPKIDREQLMRISLNGQVYLE